jgi:hypothetical protein
MTLSFKGIMRKAMYNPIVFTPTYIPPAVKAVLPGMNNEDMARPIQ